MLYRGLEGSRSTAVFIGAKAGGLGQCTLQPPPAAGGDLEPLETMLVWFLVNLLRWICWEKLWISGPIFCLINQIRI